METMLRLASRFAADHPSEAARRLEALSAGEVASFLERVDPTTAAHVLEHMVPAIAASSVEPMEVDRSSTIVSLLPFKHGVHLLRHLDQETRAGIVRLLPESLAAQAERNLRFPEGTAGEMADSSVEPLPSDMTVSDALRVARDPRFPYVYVVDRNHRLVGVAHKRDVHAGDLHTTLDAIKAPEVIRVPAHTTGAELQRHRAWRDLDALPVVDRDGVYVGAIRHKTLRALGEPRSATGGAGSALVMLLDVAEVYWFGLSSVVAALAERTVALHGGKGHDER